MTAARQIKAELELSVAEHKKAQEDLDGLYNPIFAGQTPSFPEEDQQENLTRQASQEYQRLEGAFRAEQRVRELLMQEQQIMKVCAAHIDKALDHSRIDIIGGGEFSDYMERSALGRADQAAAQIYRFREQARKLSPHIQPLPPLQIAQGDLVADVLFDNIFTDMEFDRKIQQSDAELKRVAFQLRQDQDSTDRRLKDLSKEMSSASEGLEQSRKQLQKVREGIFDRMLAQLAQYQH